MSDSNENTINKFYYYYECARCIYKTNYITSMKKHISVKKKCSNIKNNNLSDEVLNKMSLIKKINNNLKKDKLSEEENNNDLLLNKNIDSDINSNLNINLDFENNNNNNNNHNKNDNNNHNNNDNNKDNNNNNDKNKDNNNTNKKCEYCDKIFYSKQNLLKHYDVCKKNPLYFENLKNKKQTELNELINNQKNKNEETLNITNNITNNTINNTIIENQQNNFIINLSNENNNKDFDKILIPFFDKFDTSHINDDIQLNLLLSHLYYDTLKEILKNKVNLNFLLDKDSNQSFIFKNDNENIVKIDNIIIYNNVWKKVRDYLLESLESVKIKKPKTDINIFNFIENKIKDKYNEFIKDNNKNYSDAVIETINIVFEENKNETEKIFKFINNNNMLEDK